MSTRTVNQKRYQESDIDSITLDVVRRKNERWGIEIHSEKGLPSKIKTVRPRGACGMAGVQVGDYILAINGISCISYSHDEVIELIHDAGKVLKLKLLPPDSLNDLDYAGHEQAERADGVNSEPENDEDDSDTQSDQYEEPNITKKPTSSGPSWWNDNSVTDAMANQRLDDGLDDKPIINSLKGVDESKGKKPKQSQVQTIERNDPMRYSSSSSSSSSEVDFEAFCKQQEEKAKKSKASTANTYQQQRLAARNNASNMNNDFTYTNLNYMNKNITRDTKIDQERFLIKDEDVKDFDRNYKSEGTFQGGRAVVAGAFTGEHNVLVDGDKDVKGVKNRVLAGRQHFDIDSSKNLHGSKDKGKVVLYTTSLTVDRLMHGHCKRAVQLIRTTRVKFEERDIYLNIKHKDDLFDRIGFEPNSTSKYPDLPIIYIDGILIGGFEELTALSDCGDLRIRLKDFTKYYERENCPKCGGSGEEVCKRCNGKKVMKETAFGQLKCKLCDRNGNVECDSCLEDVGVVEYCFKN